MLIFTYKRNQPSASCPAGGLLMGDENKQEVLRIPPFYRLPPRQQYFKAAQIILREAGYVGI